jgi:Short C-terminal domain
MARTAVVAGTATAVSGGMMRRQERRAQQQQEASAYEQQQYGTQQMAAPPPPPAAPAPATGTDQLVAQLKELGDLKDRGILTEAEFDQQKARLLAQ